MWLLFFGYAGVMAFCNWQFQRVNPLWDPDWLHPVWPTLILSVCLLLSSILAWGFIPALTERTRAVSQLKSMVSDRLHLDLLPSLSGGMAGKLEAFFASEESS